MTAPASRAALIEIIDRVVADTAGLNFGESILTAMETAECAVVPMEATDLMVCVADEADRAAADQNLDEGGPGRGLYEDGIYRAMLAASPYAKRDGQ